MEYYPVLPYSFIILTLTGTATVDLPETQWDVPAKAEVSGPGADMVRDYIGAYGIGFRGQLFTLDAVSPQDLHHALLMNETTHKDISVRSFEVIGYVPETVPDEDERWADDDSEEEEA